MEVVRSHRDVCNLIGTTARIPSMLLCHEYPYLAGLFYCSCRHREFGFQSILMFSPSVRGNAPTMASADFCYPIPTPRDAGSQWQDYRPPRVMRVTFTLIPAASTSAVSV